MMNLSFRRYSSAAPTCKSAALFAIWVLAVGVTSSMAQDTPVTGEVPAEGSTGQVEVAQLPYQQLVAIARDNSSPSGDRAPDAASATDPAAGAAADPAVTADDDAPMVLRISSTQGVAVGEITLSIRRASGTVAIDISENGDFTVPWSQELYDENPMVVSNQPKGTMNLAFTIAIPEVRPKVIDGKVKYQDLFRQLLEAQKAMRRTNPEFGTPGAETFAIQVIGGGTDVAIVRKLGSRTIEPDADGAVWLVYDLLLYEENPEVTLPKNAQVNIVPVDGRMAVRIRAQ